jgi:uncharacterized delta-60 repeat protein
MARSRRLAVQLTFGTAFLVALPLVAYAMAGDLDTSFSGDGMQTTNVGATGSASTVVRLAGGKLLVYGTSGSGMALVRYTNGGNPDTTFGGGDGIVTFSALSEDNPYNSLSVLQSGKILVAAEADTAGGLAKLALFRFTPSGNKDATFGGGTGKRVIGFQKSFYAYDLAVLSNGKFLVGGEFVRTLVDDQFMVVRLKPSGAIDHTFGGGDGIVRTNFSAGTDGAWRIAVDPQGRILAGGWAEESAGASKWDVALARYTPGGALDHTFSGDGKVHIQLYKGGDDYIYGLRLEGSRVVGGVYTKDSGGKERIALIRWAANGTLDHTFGGGDGKVITTNPDNMALQDITVDSAGRIVVGTYDRTVSQMVVARYRPGGTLDPSFGTGGFSLTTAFGSGAFPDGITIDSNKKIVLVGGTSSMWAAARYLSS